MEWKLDKNRPLKEQICEQICLRIALNEFEKNGRLMSVRDAAIEMGVNPNTVQQSFEMLEREGILYSVRGSGWFVSEDTGKARTAYERLLREKTAAYFENMSALGLDKEAVKNYVKEFTLHEERKDDTQ